MEISNLYAMPLQSAKLSMLLRLNELRASLRTPLPMPLANSIYFLNRHTIHTHTHTLSGAQIGHMTGVLTATLGFMVVKFTTGL